MALILSAVIFDMNIIDRFPSFLPLQTKMEKTMKSSCIVIADFAQRIGNLGDSLAVPETLYDSSITRPDPCLIRCYERIFRKIQELISHDFLDTLNHKRIFRALRKQPKTKNLRRLIRALKGIRLHRVGKLMEYYEKGVPVAQFLVQVLSTVSLKYRRLITSWQYTHNGYVCVTGPLPFLEYLAH